MKTIQYQPKIDGLRAIAVLSDKKRGIFNFKNFLIKRIKRLLLAIVFVALLTICFSFLILSPDDLINFSRSIITSIFFVSNILYWTESNYFNQISEFKPFLHTWSLGVEMSFYLIWPIILIFLIKLLKQQQIVFFLITTSILSLVFIEYIYTKRLLFETDIFRGFFYALIYNRSFH